MNRKHVLEQEVRGIIGNVSGIIDKGQDKGLPLRHNAHIKAMRAMIQARELLYVAHGAILLSGPEAEG